MCTIIKVVINHITHHHQTVCTPSCHGGTQLGRERPVTKNSQQALIPLTYKETAEPIAAAVGTAKSLMLACPLFLEFCEPNKTAKLMRTNINCRPKNRTKLLQYFKLYHCMGLICQNKGAKSFCTQSRQLLGQPS